MKKDIKGSGGLLGKKPKSSASNNVQDTGFSNSQVYILDVVCEGEIGGIKQIFLDDTPVFDANMNNINFPNVTFDIKKGTLTQDLPAARTGSAIARSVGVEVKNAQPPIIRQYVNPDIDKLVITTRFTLQDSTDEKRGTVASSCAYRISVKSGSGAFVPLVERTISGLYRSAVEVQDEIPVDNFGGTVDTFQVKLEKLSQDSTATNLTRVLEWSSTSEVTTDRITYEKTAYVQIGFPSSIFNGEVPRKYEVDGLLFKIPSNATVNPVDGGLDFNGLWNGTLYKPTQAVCDPAWQLLGLLTDDFFSVGNDVGVTDINIQDLYKISQYNNEFISDGRGGFERRYRCSTVINSRSKASKILEQFCSNMNVKYYSYSGQLRFWQDRPVSTVEVAALITNSDVIDGKFRYGFSGAQSQATLYNVVWNNPIIDYERDIEPVRYDKGMREEGVITEEIVAFGCYSVSQAIRYGRRAIYDNWLNTKTINIKMRPKGLFLYPGKSIEVCDNDRLRFRSSGLVKSGTQSYVDLDSGVAIESGVNYIIRLTRDDGTIEERNVINSPGINNRITPHIPFSFIPSAETTWILKTNSNIETFIILDVNLDKDFNVEIIGIKYEAAKYVFMESNILVANDPISISKPPDIVAKPQNIVYDRFITGSNLAIFFTWNNSISVFVKGYIVEISRDGITWGGGEVILGQYSYLLENALEGVYKIRVAAIDILNKVSEWSYSDSVYISRTSVDMDLNNPFTFEY